MLRTHTDNRTSTSLSSAGVQQEKSYITYMHIVLVEDNTVLATSLVSMLKHEGYGVTWFSNGQTACSWLVDNQAAYDLVILDVLLPEMSGFEICQTLRVEHCKIPILMLTSKGSLEDTIEGLDKGADDYLKKPFAFQELLARVRSLARRQPHVIDAEIQLAPGVRVDVLSQKVIKEEREVHLTAKEYGVLSYFLHHPNKIITQQELYDHVFDFAEVQLSNTIEVHIKNLRKKLRTKTSELPLVTVRNAGYRFEYEK